MRLLYIASNPSDADSLLLEREITELQRLLGRSDSSVRVDMKFLPEVAIENFASEISSFCPTVLHISAHGNEQHLYFKNASDENNRVRVTGDTLAALLDVPTPPTLLYLNACDSIEIAAHTTKIIPIAIGTTSPISNRAARVSAVRFYELLLDGETVAQAFKNSKALLEAVSERQMTKEISTSGLLDPNELRLVEVIQIIARFGSEKGPDFIPGADGEFAVEVGIIGCPPCTTAVTIFTDDDTFSPILGSAKGPPIRGRLWIESNEEPYGDFRIGAGGITGDGRSFSAFSTLCDALTRYYTRGGYGKLNAKQEREFRSAIAMLLKYDGG